MGTGGHYITMLPADWSIFTSHDPLPSSCHSKNAMESVYTVGYYFGSIYVVTLIQIAIIHLTYIMRNIPLIYDTSIGTSLFVSYLC